MILKNKNDFIENLKNKMTMSYDKKKSNIKDSLKYILPQKLKHNKICGGDYAITYMSSKRY